GEGSSTPTEPYHTPSPEAQQTSPTTHSSPSLPPITTASIPTVTPSDTSYLRKYTRRARIAQSLALSPIVDEPASPLGDDSQCEACPTDSGIEADQDRENIAKTSTLPHEQQLEMVSRFEAQELEINSLKARIKLLEDKDRGVAEQSRDDAPIKGGATILASGVVDVSTSSRSISTAGPPATGVPIGSDVVPTAGLIFATATVFTPYTRRKGKETMVESETPKDQRISEQIAKDAKIARIHTEEEL
nr:hypothetical protein [Tanacetum cinerariifolium]